MQKRISLLLLVILAASQSIFADYKITQRTSIEDVTTEVTVWAKGVRERRQQKMILEDADEETAAMMAKMMPNLTTISQCDLKQDITLNEKKRAYFIDYYDWSALPPGKMKRTPDQGVVIKGTATVSSVVTDSTKRQEMFGLPARWLKAVMTIETSADSCEGKSSVRTEQEGWFVNLTLSNDTCQISPKAPESNGGCRPKLIMNAMQNPGFMLEGTTKMFENNKLQSTVSLQTTALSKATLDQNLFEIPTDFAEVDSLSKLMESGGMGMDLSVLSEKSDDAGNSKKRSNVKTVAIDFFSGNYSKVDQDAIRLSMQEKLNAKGFEASLVRSSAEISNGRFDFVVGVEIVSTKQSKSGKIGGLFGKVTGTSDAAKAGDSEAEVLVTVYQKDGKTVVAQQSAKQKLAGTPDDAARAAIESALNQMAGRMK